MPILQALLDNPSPLFALVLTPTRYGPFEINNRHLCQQWHYWVVADFNSLDSSELAFQIGEQFDALGATIGAKCAVVVGGVDMMQQAMALARKV